MRKMGKGTEGLCSINRIMGNLARLWNLSVTRVGRWTRTLRGEIMPGDGHVLPLGGFAMLGATSGRGLIAANPAAEESLVEHLAWMALWVGGLAILLAIAWYFVDKIRPKAAQSERPANEWLAKYREMNSRGELSDEEFRTIKTRLADQLQDELNINGNKG
jgi:hypothetical protein